MSVTCFCLGLSKSTFHNLPLCRMNQAHMPFLDDSCRTPVRYDFAVSVSSHTQQSRKPDQLPFTLTSRAVHTDTFHNALHPVFRFVRKLRCQGYACCVALLCVSFCPPHQVQQAQEISTYRHCRYSSRSQRRCCCSCSRQSEAYS